MVEYRHLYIKKRNFSLDANCGNDTTATVTQNFVLVDEAGDTLVDEDGNILVSEENNQVGARVVTTKKRTFKVQVKV